MTAAHATAHPEGIAITLKGVRSIRSSRQDVGVPCYPFLWAIYRRIPIWRDRNSSLDVL
jgi:hypothetical protein